MNIQEQRRNKFYNIEKGFRDDDQLIYLKLAKHFLRKVPHIENM